MSGQSGPSSHVLSDLAKGKGGINCTLFKCEGGVNFLDALASIGMSGDPHVGVGASGGFSPSVGGGRSGGADLPDH